MWIRPQSKVIKILQFHHGIGCLVAEDIILLIKYSLSSEVLRAIQLVNYLEVNPRKNDE